MISIRSELQDFRVISPGRINLIGEHTDYNQGYAVPAAIEQHIMLSLHKKQVGDGCTIYSETLDASFRPNLNKLTQSSVSWENYILGVLYELQETAEGLVDFDCEIRGALPSGAGLSSSAALECGLAFGLNELFGLGLSLMELARLAQRAEHNYAGTLCGIMDQFAVLAGKKNHFILLDCRSMEYRYIPAKLGPYKLLLINSRITHSLAESAYNQRRGECLQGVRWLQKHFPHLHSLRDISREELINLQEEMPETLFNRCLYVVEENDRVLEAVNALESSDIKKLGMLLSKTHQGLRHQYQVSCPELDYLVDTALSLPGVLGARMMGGGFGGCSLNLVHEEALKDVSEHLESAYGRFFGREAEVLEVSLGDGVRLLS